jgi:hypothetical protein
MRVPGGRFLPRIFRATPDPLRTVARKIRKIPQFVAIENRRCKDPCDGPGFDYTLEIQWFFGPSVGCGVVSLNQLVMVRIHVPQL